MKAASVTILVGLLLVSSVGGQGQRAKIGPLLASPSYRLWVTPLDWKFASRTGVSSHKVEEQVVQRLFEGLGWEKERKEPEPGEREPLVARIRVELDVTEEPRQEISYRFRLTIETPEGWTAWVPKRREDPAWRWSGDGEGFSARGDYPRDLRLELDRVLKELQVAWKARWEEAPDGR